MSTSTIQFSSKIFLKFLKLNRIHIIEDKLTKYYINVYTCYRILTASNGLRIKARKKLYIKIKKMLRMCTSIIETINTIADIDIHKHITYNIYVDLHIIFFLGEKKFTSVLLFTVG